MADEKPDFAEATRPEYVPVSPSDTHLNGKKIVDLRAEVQKIWPTVVFVRDGKKVTYTAVMKTEKGDITLEFYPDKAPNQVRNFIALAKAGFYKDCRFHRNIPGFMVQGGCPKGSGTGGPGYCVKPEFNDIQHTRGILSTARAQPLDSAGSQFFIMVDQAPHLDRQYTAFGKVTSGMEAVDKIVNSGAQPALIDVVITETTETK